MRKNVLLLSAYDAQSHRYWCQGLIKAFAEFEWTYLTLPARYFSWRIRGNSLTWAFTEQSKLNKSFDLIIATSMVDLSSLIGLRPSLANVPSIIYFHENQFAYPSNLSPVHPNPASANSKQHKSIEPQIVNLYSALASSKVIFNSQYNLDSFLAGAKNLLQTVPDHVPKNLLSLISNKSSVLPVPLDDTLFNRVAKKPARLLRDDRFQVVWNHRWEYDKNPAGLLALLRELDSSLSFCFHIVGQSFRTVPIEFAQINKLLKDRRWLGLWGYRESKQNYREVLESSQVVLSTAIHDFQGLSVLEAVALGCSPLVPDRLSYRELFPAASRYVSCVDESQGPDLIQKEARSAAQKLEALYLAYQSDKGLPSSNIDHLAWSNMRSGYAKVFFDLLP